jgi:outer membrane receptor protein involved in Fe transport
MGGTGGTIILTPKQASFEEDFNDFMVRGSYSRASGSRLKFMSDINRVDELEQAAVRLPFTYEWRQPGWAPSNARHGTMFSATPSISWRVTDRLTAGLDLFYQYNDQPAYQGIRTAYGKPIFTGWDDTYTEADDRMKFKTFGGTFRLDGELTDWAKTRTRISYFQTDTDYNYRGPFSNKGFDNNKKKYEWAAGDRLARNLYLGQDFIFEFDTGEVEHTFLVGANLFHKRNNGKSQFTSAGPVNLDALTSTDETQIKLGLQAQDVMQWRGVALLTGLRADWHESVNSVHAWTYSPRLGLSYDILEEGKAFLYANASITENPNFNYKATPNNTGTSQSDYLNTTWRAVQKEVGLRVNPVGSLWASVAAFWIDQSNAPILMAGNGPDDGYYSSDGKTSSKGIEFSLSGNITDNWSVYAAYAYSHYYDHNTHSHFDRYPPHAISFWTSYKAPWFYDAVFGFGARWRDDWLMTFRGSPAGDDQCAKSLLTFDASLDFPISETLSLGFSLRNIFDTRGIESARNLQAFANDGRTFEVFMRWRF